MATTKRQPLKKKLPSKAEVALRFIQFSKKITVYILAFWGVYRLAQLVVVILRPEIAEDLVKFSSGVDTVAISFGLAYSANSISEKAMQMHKDVQKYMYLGVDADEEEKEKGASNASNG